MKKSEKIRYAMIAVVGGTMAPGVKLEVLEMLFDERRIALWFEEQEAKEAEQEA